MWGANKKGTVMVSQGYIYGPSWSSMDLWWLILVINVTHLRRWNGFHETGPMSTSVRHFWSLTDVRCSAHWGPCHPWAGRPGMHERGSWMWAWKQHLSTGIYLHSPGSCLSFPWPWTITCKPNFRVALVMVLGIATETKCVQSGATVCISDYQSYHRSAV